MKRIFAIFAVLMLLPLTVFAQDVPIGDWLTQVFDFIKLMGGLEWGAKVMTICALLVGSMKVTFLRSLIWDKLGGLKFLVSPALALIGGTAGLWLDGHAPTFAILSAYFLAGLGGNLLKDLLENLKQIPGLGAGIIKVINMIESLMDVLKIGRA